MYYTLFWAFTIFIWLFRAILDVSHIHDGSIVYLYFVAICQIEYGHIFKILCTL